jgi:4,5-dihydroxyphthalate decarboxylase
MSELKLTIACGDYEIIRPLKEGRVKIDGVDLTMLTENAARDRTFRIERNAETDAGEMNVCGYYMARDRGHAAVGLPIFLHRRFRHGFLFVNPAKGITKPSDVKGGKIACLGGINAAACVWLRGILGDHYGLTLEDATWYTDTPHEFFLPHGTTLKEKEGFDVRVVTEPPLLEEQLLAGEIDLLMAPGYPKSFLAGDKRIARLFPDYAAEETAYYKKTGLFPIMHTLIIKQELVEKHPWLAPNIAYAFNESKRIALHHLSNPRALPIAFYTSAMEEQTALLGPDPWQYSMNAINRNNVETSLRYTYEQGLISTKPTIDELFYSLDQIIWRGIQGF